MANITETPSYDAGIYQIETTDPVLGGPNGIANAQAKGLANRTAFLNQQINQLNSGQLKPSWIASTDYVQGELQKLDAKQSVQAATTANITLSGVQTIDGVALTVGERVLVKDQTAAAQNGIYLVSAQGWTRATDADDGTKLNNGARIAIESGTINAGSIWYLATSGSISVGSTALLFSNEHPDASDTTKGIVRFATQAEVDASSLNNAAVSPGKLAYHYRRGNIIGGVSQSSGIPTGAIIEKGSNANGSYVKFADGTMLCSIVASLNTGTPVASGQFFYSSGTHQWTYPAQFVAPPCEEVTAKWIDTSVSDATQSWAVHVRGPSGNATVSQQARIMSTSSWANAGVEMHRFAKGRWY
ncbi:hypothetical protein [Aeromonas enteropelogenes]|uniref:hypothetical protein n=1 Tax=Aeromonas enteropelogenes TaxID=29489 RepID=UPI003BA30D97